MTNYASLVFCDANSKRRGKWTGCRQRIQAVSNCGKADRANKKERQGKRWLFLPRALCTCPQMEGGVQCMEYGLCKEQTFSSPPPQNQFARGTHAELTQMRLCLRIASSLREQPQAKHHHCHLIVVLQLELLFPKHQPFSFFSCFTLRLETCSWRVEISGLRKGAGPCCTEHLKYARDVSTA
jgi:hypothetical protein